jgi:Zn-dependent protease with chaperone function
MEYDGRLPEEGINTSPEHPLRELAVLIGGVIGVAVVFTVVAALSIDRLVPLLSPELEVRIFGSWLAPGDDAAAAEESDPRTASVQMLLDRMAVHWPGHPYTFRVSVIDEAEPNALALPGGWIIVTDGLLDQAGSENELALVLGHELGHYHGRDHLRGLGRGVALSLVLSAMGNGGEVVLGLAELASDVAGRSFDRDQESAADAFGLGLLHAEYGHVAGAEDFFARQARDGKTGETLGVYFSTHPLYRDRVEALERHARERGWGSEAALQPLDLDPL